MTTVLPQIDSFAKSRSESDSEIYEDNQQSTSPVSTDSDRVKPYVPDLSIKFEHQEHDSVITYGGDDVVDNYENVSFLRFFELVLAKISRSHFETYWQISSRSGQFTVYHPRWTPLLTSFILCHRLTSLLSVAKSFQTTTSTWSQHWRQKFHNTIQKCIQLNSHIESQLLVSRSRFFKTLLYM